MCNKDIFKKILKIIFNSVIKLLSKHYMAVNIYKYKNIVKI